MNLLIKYF